jgi:hypothetical protein
VTRFLRKPLVNLAECMHVDRLTISTRSTLSPPKIVDACKGARASAKLTGTLYTNEVRHSADRGDGAERIQCPA